VWGFQIFCVQNAIKCNFADLVENYGVILLNIVDKIFVDVILVGGGNALWKEYGW
jgi:hypothetical protein